MKIYFIRHETTYGPFFSSLTAVRKYLRDPDARPSDTSVDDILAGNNSYISVEEVELNDDSVRFDG